MTAPPRWAVLLIASCAAAGPAAGVGLALADHGRVQESGYAGKVLTPHHQERQGVLDLRSVLDPQEVVS